jgi:hypothetical protein
LSSPSTRQTGAPMIDWVFAIKDSPLPDSVLRYSSMFQSLKAFKSFERPGGACHLNKAKRLD